MWPEYWDLDQLLGVKASVALPKWNSQYMQNPTSEEGALIKREWWKKWKEPKMPKLKHVIQSYDTAYLKKETADFSAITTWGVFSNSEDRAGQFNPGRCSERKIRVSRIKAQGA